MDPESKKNLNDIIKLSENAKNLIGEMYEYSKLSHLSFSFGEIDLNKVLDEVRLRLNALLLESNAQIQINPLPQMICDRVRVSEIFANLISNAIKYNESRTKLIEVGFKYSHLTPVFYVRDNGIGIHPEDQQRVFQMFERLHAREAYGGGTGWGLAIVKRIVDRHGGRIWIESEIGKGTVFYFTLGPEQN